MGFLRVDEVVEFELAFGVVAGDLHHVLGVPGGEIGIVVDQHLAHARGVVDVFAKNNGLGKAVGGLEKLADALRDCLVALGEHQCLVHVALVVDAVFDELTLAVDLAGRRSPAEVLVEIDANDLVRCEETVFYALLE